MDKENKIIVDDIEYPKTEAEKMMKLVANLNEAQMMDLAITGTVHKNLIRPRTKVIKQNRIKNKLAAKSRQRNRK